MWLIAHSVVLKRACIVIDMQKCAAIALPFANGYENMHVYFLVLCLRIYPIVYKSR